MICKYCKREIPDGSKSCCFCQEKQVPKEKKWICPKCNFLNQNSHFDCNGCGADKPSNPKFVEVERVELTYSPSQRSGHGVKVERERSRVREIFLNIACVLVIIQSIYLVILTLGNFRFLGVGGLVWSLVLLGLALLRNRGGTVAKIVIETVILLIAVGDGVNSVLDMLFVLLIPIIVIPLLFIGWRELD